MFRFLLHAYGEFGPRHPLRPAVWPHFDLLFVHDGRLVVRVDGHAPVELVTGEGILLFPDTPLCAGERKLEARASVQHFSIVDEGRLLGSFAKLSGARSGFLVRRGPRDADLERDIERAIAMAGDEDLPGRQMAREALLVLILGRFLETDGSASGKSHGLDSLLEWMRSRPVEQLDSDVLAARLGVSLATLRRRFRSQLGISPAQYLIRLRINEAKRLLGETMSPVKEIANRCGYGSLIAFHRAFRAATGSTPRTFRMLNRLRG